MDVYHQILDITIFVTLGIMSTIALGVGIERIMLYRDMDIDKYQNKKALELELSNNLTIVSTIAANAPYVGLLGTVFGIILTFYTIGTNGINDTSAIMVGLALALKATAFGLIVAIPAIIFHNYLVRKMEVLITRWEIKFENQKN